MTPSLISLNVAGGSAGEREYSADSEESARLRLLGALRKPNQVHGGAVQGHSIIWIASSSLAMALAKAATARKMLTSFWVFMVLSRKDPLRSG